MAELLQMWAMVEVLGFVCLPLTVTVFHNLPDRGWAFSKAIGTAVLAFCVWLPLMCLSVLPFSQFFIAGIFLLLLAGNIIGFLKVRQTIAKVVRVNVPYILISEAVFAGMMFLLGWIRSFVPDIRAVPISLPTICGSQATPSTTTIMLTLLPLSWGNCSDRALRLSLTQGSVCSLV